MDSNKEPTDVDTNMVSTKDGEADAQAEYGKISKWIHIGRSTSTCYAGKCISAVIVIDFLYRDVVIPLLSPELARSMVVPHPLSSVFLNLSLEKLVWKADDYSRVEDAYITMCKYLSTRNLVTQADTWITFLNKFRRGCYILSIFTQVCVSSEHPKISPSPIQFAAENWHLAEQMTNMLTKKSLKDKSVKQMVTNDSIENILSGEVNADAKDQNTTKKTRNQNTKRRQKRLRGVGQEPNEDHQMEDNIISTGEKK